MHVEGKTIVVTGASGGLGRSITRLLAERGARLIVTGRGGDALAALAAETGAEVIEADLGNRADVDRLAERAASADVLVANAGIGDGSHGTDLDTATIDHMIDVNLRSPAVLATSFAQAHVAAGTPGQIVLMGSLSGVITSPNTIMYNTTKFGLRGFSLALRQDFAASGIGVTIVEPGFIRDAGMFADGGTEVPSVVRTKSPEDVARAVIKAIEKNPAELFVAPTELRFGATLGSVAPRLSEALQRRLVARDIIRKD